MKVASEINQHSKEFSVYLNKSVFAYTLLLLSKDSIEDENGKSLL